MRYLIAFTLIFSVAAALARAEGAPPERRFAVPEVKADFAELYQRLAASHFDLYARRSRAEYDALFARMQAAFDKPLTATEMRVAFQRFMAFGNVAHARIEFPADAYGAYRDAKGRVMPLFARFIEGRAFVTENGSDAPISPGEEIRALNGEPFDAWRRRLAANISADNDYMTDTLLENRFGRLLWLELGAIDHFQLTLGRPGGAAGEISIPARTRDEILASLSRRPAALDLDWNARTFKMVGSVGYLRPGPFYNNDPNATNIWDTIQFKAFIDDAFTQLLSAKARAVVIDLRNNPGGDNSFSDLMVAWFATKPFRFCRDFLIRQSEAAVASNAKRVALAAGNPDAISAKLAAAYAAHRNGDVFSFEIPIVAPRTGERFTGKVYLLINRHSYSNTVQVAALAQDYRFATILGEETSDLATTYGAMEQFTLSRSGIDVGFPKAQIIRVNGDTPPRGVVPDIAIETPIVEPASDPVLTQALAIAGR